MTPAVQTLLIANVICYLLESVGGEGLITSLALWPLNGPFMP